MPMHLEILAQVGTLIFDKDPTKISAKYCNYSKVFLAKNAAELQKLLE